MAVVFPHPGNPVNKILTAPTFSIFPLLLFFLLFDI